MNHIEAFCADMRASGHSAQVLNDTTALVDSKFLVIYRYPAWQTFRWDADARIYGGPQKGAWEFIAQSLNMRGAARAVVRGY